MMADMDELVFLKTLRALRILKMARYSRGLRNVQNLFYQNYVDSLPLAAVLQ